MTWFEELTGFTERSYAHARHRLSCADGRLYSDANGRSWAVGGFRLASLAELREIGAGGRRGTLAFRNVSGDVAELHQDSAYEGALFQVASQFNCLEMTGPGVTPEDGVTRYQSDATQGPACAIAAGAATLYRNYFVPVGDGLGQTSDCQIDCLSDIGHALSVALDRPVSELWDMSNGYALCSRSGLLAIEDHLRRADAAAVDALRASLRIGIHQDVEVTEARSEPLPIVSQAFCSALPVSYSSVPNAEWAAFATLVLEAAYEATLWAAVANASRGASNIVVLTRLGGGAFGNADAWIDTAIARALGIVQGFDLDVRLLSRGEAPESMIRLESDFA